jgi:hypothetical protein
MAEVMAGEVRTEGDHPKTKSFGWRCILQNKIIGSYNSRNANDNTVALFLLLILLLFLSCAGPGRFTRLEKTGGTPGNSFFQTNFDSLWSSRTILITPQSQAMQGSPIMTPGMQPGRPAGGTRFELIVRATLMDSTVIKSGINEYAQLISMSTEEKNDFRMRFDQEHYQGQYLYIWALIMTPFSDEYLKLDRWTFFLETEAGQQLEPKKMVEQKLLPAIRARELSPDTTLESIPSPFPSRHRSRPFKIVEFYFPLNDYDSIPLLGGKFKTLKFGVVNAANLEDKSSESWNLEQIRNKN